MDAGPSILERVAYRSGWILVVGALMLAAGFGNLIAGEQLDGRGVAALAIGVVLVVLGASARAWAAGRQ